MATWKKIISSGSKAHLLNVTASGGINIGTLTGGTAGTDDVLVRDTNTGEIKYVTQASIGALGASVNAFATMSAGGTEVYADTSTDVLNFTAGNNIEITGSDGSNTLTFNAVTKSISDITTILSQSLTSGTHQNITINEPSSGVFSITGSSAISVADSTGQNGIDLTFDSTNASLTASLSGLTTESSVRFADITATGNISASGYISASALHVLGDANIGGNLTLDGNFLFDGFNFETSDILNHSGSNIFGSSSADPSTITHQFTGSVSITGSGVTLVGGVFTGDGSGLTNLSAGALPDDLLSGSAQIAGDISGSFTADGVTIALGTTAAGQFSAITAAPSIGNAGLSLGSQIYTFVTNSIENDLKPFVANNYITSITTAANSGLGGGATSGTAALILDINNLNTAAPATGDLIAFNDSGTTKSATIAALAAIITASSAGTVTNVTVGDGLEITTGGSNITNTGTIAVDAGNNITVTADGVALSQTISGVTQITATSASFGKLTVTGDTTIIETETLQIDDNFILLNKNQSGTPSEDAGIGIQRGSSANANLFWEEGIDRWSLSQEDIDSGAVGTPNAYLTSVSSSNVAPDQSTGPVYGGTSGYGNMHIDINDGEIWIYV